MVTWAHSSASRIQERFVHNLGDHRYGLVQLSCALLLERREDLKPFEPDQIAPTREQVKERKEALRGWFAPGESPYQWKTLSELAGVTREGKPLTWLDPLSRHGSYDVPLFRGYESAYSGDPVPPLFIGAKAPAYKSCPRPRARIPVQRPRNGDSSLAIEDLDHNDFIVIAIDGRFPVSRSLMEAQRFLAFLFALRRSVIFASSLRERIYNVWLPPAVLIPEGKGAPGTGKIAVFPFVGLTRRPSSQAWRYVFTFNAVIAPTNCANGTANRPFTDAEVGAIVGCLDGPSMNPTGRKWDLPEYQEAHTWREYTSHLLGPDLSLSLAGPPGSSAGTLRNWLTLLFFSVARRQREDSGTKSQGGDRQDRLLADEVLRAIRTTSCWSVLLDAPRRLKPATVKDPPPPDDGSWSPRAGMRGLMGCFDYLAIGPSKWFRPTYEDRVDQGRAGERSWISWSLPVRRCIVTFYLSRGEDFPLRSRLNLFVMFGHMIAGLMTAREILVKLGHDVELHRESQEAAERHRKYIIELEEMFDLDIAWALYRRIYRRLRKLRGLDDMYTNVRDRAEVLGQYYATLDGIIAETGRARLSWAAAILAAAIIGLTAWAALGPAPGEGWPLAGFAAFLVAVAVIWGGWGRWIDGWKRFWRRPKRLRRL